MRGLCMRILAGETNDGERSKISYTHNDPIKWWRVNSDRSSNESDDYRGRSGAGRITTENEANLGIALWLKWLNRRSCAGEWTTPATLYSTTRVNLSRESRKSQEPYNTIERPKQCRVLWMIEIRDKIWQGTDDMNGNSREAGSKSSSRG